MPAGDEIPGWTGKSPRDGPRVPDEPNIPARLGAVWQACRRQPRAVFGLAVLIQGVAGLVAAPVAVFQLQGVLNVLSGPAAGSASAGQAVDAVLPAHEPLVLLATVLSISLSYGSILLLIGTLAVVLVSPREEDHTIRASLRVLARHAMDLVLALTAVVFGATAFVSLEVALDSSSEAVAPGSVDSGAAAAQAFGLELVVLILGGLVFYGAIRWSLTLPALLLERVSLGGAFRRSSELTHGRRLSIGLTLLVVALLEGIPFAIAAYAPALLIGPGSGVDLNFIVATVVTYLAWILLAPFVPLAVVYMYRDFNAAGPRPPG